MEARLFSSKTRWKRAWGSGVLVAWFAYLIPAVAAVDVIIDPSGTVTTTDSTGKSVTVAGAKIFVQAANNSGEWTWDGKQEAVQTDAKGMYKFTTGASIKGVNVTGGKIQVRVIAKKRTVTAGQIPTVTIKQGISAGGETSPGNNGTLALPAKDIDMDTTGGPFPDNLAGRQAASLRGIFFDPGYAYTVSNPSAPAGQITFTEDLAFGTNAPIDVQGYDHYADGTEAEGNNMDTTGNPITESIFGTFLQIDPIQVLGTDGSTGRLILSGGNVQIFDGYGGTFLSGTLTDIIADPTNQIFEATISGLTLGSSSLGSRLVNEWNQHYMDGLPFKVFFDPALLTQTAAFSASGTLQSYITIASQAQFPTLTNLSYGAGQFYFTLLGQSNVSYVIQASTDLVSWSQVVTNASGPASRTVTLPAPGQRQFYRAFVGP